MKIYAKRLLPVLLVLLLTSLACNLPGMTSGGTVTPTADMITQVAMTVNAQMTAAATLAPPDATRTPETAATLPPTVTLAATSTPQPIATATAIPCNWAQYVSDVTVSDNTEVNAGASFIKSWRLKNIGTCTWTSAYQLIFVSGESMGAPAAVSMTPVNIPPGGTVDVSVTLTAPSTAGTYQGYFKLRAPDGLIFGIGPAANGAFWVKINSVAATSVPTATATATTVTQPDLIISQITFDPAEPVHGSSTHVKVTVYNNGNAATSGSFKVQWWGLESFASPSCGWDYNDSLVAHGGRVLECDFTFSSYYAPGLLSKAVADVNNTISESNEGNNAMTVPITVH